MPKNTSLQDLYDEADRLDDELNSAGELTTERLEKYNKDMGEVVKSLKRIKLIDKITGDADDTQNEDVLPTHG